jgi:menaquinone-specific isochorismate synthase
VLRSLERKAYQKIVLARKVTFEFAEGVDPACLVRALKEKTGRCFHFLFQPHRRAAFVGASPESLYRRDGRILTTEAIAGSRPRGYSKDGDRVLKDELMTNEKELREHAFVVTGIGKSLGGLCPSLVGDESPEVLRLPRCQHLITRFKGQLADGVKDADLLAALHPTPAVGGYPTNQALSDILRLESFDRGWYAGPVGWMSKYGAQFAVGIRSGLCDGSRMHLFSGAGIVDGSVPDREWDEVENKISDFVNLLVGF